MQTQKQRSFVRYNVLRCVSRCASIDTVLTAVFCCSCPGAAAGAARRVAAPAGGEADLRQLAHQPTAAVRRHRLL